MASPTRWTWVWVSSGSWWWTGRPGVLQSMGSQRVRHNWATELSWTPLSQMDYCCGSDCSPVSALLSFPSFFSFLEYTRLTMLCYFLLYNKVNQLCVNICPLPLESPSHTPVPSVYVITGYHDHFYDNTKESRNFKFIVGKVHLST